MKNKTLATYLTLFLGLFGIHYFYLNKYKKFAFMHIILTIILILGISLFKENNTWFVWLCLSLGVINWSSIWLSSIYFGLMPPKKWINFVQKDENKSFTDTSISIQKAISYSSTNSLTVLCIIIALMIGMGTLMAFLAFAFQSYFEYIK